MSNITARLINAFRQNVADGYVVWGEIYEDTTGRFRDGQLIRTSLVLHKDGDIICTKNSIYEVESWG